MVQIIVATPLLIMLTFVILAVILISLDSWWGLLLAIIKGDKTNLKDNILESGICTYKRDGWLPYKPNPTWFIFPKIKDEEDQEPKAIKPKLPKTKPPLYRAREEQIDPGLAELAKELFAELD